MLSRTPALKVPIRKAVPTLPLHPSKILTAIAGYSRRSRRVFPAANGNRRMRTMDVATLAQLLRETSEYHDTYEKTHPKHDWWDWYARYLFARQNGSSAQDAVAAANVYVDQILARKGT